MESGGKGEGVGSGETVASDIRAVVVSQLQRSVNQPSVRSEKENESAAVLLVEWFQSFFKQNGQTFVSLSSLIFFSGCFLDLSGFRGS